MGTLYLIQSNDYIKIGYTVNLEKRLKQYNTHNPEYKILYVREGTASDEYFLHKIFEKYLINDTEWMQYNEYIINTFKTIKLNHKESIKNSKKNNKRKNHVKQIIKQRKAWKESNTIHIVNGNIHKLYR